jgi:ribosomal protein L2
MAIKTYKPTSPGRRQMTRTVGVAGTENAPHKPLLDK